MVTCFTCVLFLDFPFRFYIFFFFKQKTAYEMRISDWSSDVCSSDLYCRLTTKGQAMLHRSIDNSHRIVVPHVIKGETIIEAEVEHHSRATGDVVMTPAIDLNTLIWPRSEPGPAFQTPISDIVDFLVEIGRAHV